MKSAVAAEKQKLATDCPRCGKPLTDPHGMGWCQGCGFCKSLAEDKAKVVLEPAAAQATPKSLAGVVEAGKLATQIPRWFWPLMLGVIGFAGASQLPARQLAPNSLERALWTTGQIAAGLSLILLAQFIALLRIAPEDEKLSFKDMFLPTRLWVLVFKRLPALRVPVWLAGWGLAIIVSACVFIGGLGYWMTYLPGGKNAPTKNKVIR
jgi:hypothetical protein